MTRSLDIRRRSATRAHHLEAEPPSIKRRHPRYLFWLLLLVVIIVAIIITLAYYQINRSGNQTLVSPEANAETNINAVSAPNQSLTGLFDATSSTTVSVYNSGAGAEKAERTVNDLKKLGYKANYLKESQLSYNQTYVWYRPELAAKAEELALQLKTQGYTVGLKESRVSGSFDILVYLSK